MKRLFPVALFALVVPIVLNAQMILNEVMYYPDPNEPEWVELYNAGTESVTIVGWTIREDSNSSGSSTVPFSSVVPAGDYLVVTGNLTKFTERWGEIPSPVIEAGFSYLNNNGGDCVRLRNGAGETVDEVCYEDAWGGKSGRSLERKGATMPSMDSASWGTAIDENKGTPGRSNSIATVAVPSLPAETETTVQLFPNPAAEYVRVTLPDFHAANTTEVQIIDAGGALLRTLPISSEHLILSVEDLPCGLYRLCFKGSARNGAGRFFTVLR